MSNFIAERKMLVSYDDKAFLDKNFDKCLKIYNTGVKHINKMLNVLYNDDNFNKYSENLDKYKDDFYNLLNSYGLNEYNIQAYLVKAKNNYKININIVQKIGTNLNKSLYKLVFKKKYLNYKKYGSLNSFEGKKNNCDIIYKRDSVYILGKTFKLKEVRHNDYYLQKVLKNKVAYCRIVRKPSNSGYNYYLQLILEGDPPKKLKRGMGKAGLDQGISTLAVYGNKVSFYTLAQGVEKYDKEIKRLAIKYNRQLRFNNLDKIENGKFKKGVKLKKSRNAYKTLFKLKNAYRRKSCCVKDYNRYINNILINSYGTFITEDMDYKKFAKKSKVLKRQDKLSIVKGKEVYKFKKKKRFGKSILNRSPGFRQSDLEYKCQRYGNKVLIVDKSFKASQFNHITKEYEKHKLSERTKLIDNKRVQRDLYSAFLLKNTKRNLADINVEKCNEEFNKFLEEQEKLIKIIKDDTKNFGLKDFKN